MILYIFLIFLSFCTPGPYEEVYLVSTPLVPKEGPPTQKSKMSMGRFGILIYLVFSPDYYTK